MSGPDSRSKRVTIAVSASISVTESKPAHVSKSKAIRRSVTFAFSDSDSVAEPKPVAQLRRGA